MLHVRLYISRYRLYMGEWNCAGPGRPDTSMYFLARPSEFSATQLEDGNGSNQNEVYHLAYGKCLPVIAEIGRSNVTDRQVVLLAPRIHRPPVVRMQQERILVPHDLCMKERFPGGLVHGRVLLCLICKMDAPGVPRLRGAFDYIL